ncbi:hypothetical protein [Pedobacter agri]|uniref:hypothetical protein n=1 Tax=Pedobacter agri TaxID=454586 RepID=UPI002931BDE6|nr:hypothetical protein [Pedobacter agri]
MYRNILILCFILSSKLSLAQISLDDLLKIQKSDVGTITSLLIDKNWQLIESKQETDDDYGKMNWAKGVDQFESDKATAWLNIDYSETVHNRVTLQAFSKLLYQNIKAKIISYGMKKISYGLMDGYSFNDYAGVNYAIRIGVGSNSGSNVSRYIFIIWNKADYKNIMEDKYESN